MVYTGAPFTRTFAIVIAKEREKLEGYAEAKAKLIEQQAVIAAL